MNIIYLGEELTNFNNSIMLLGPSPRIDLTHSWRENALSILEKLNFKGTVIIPEFRNKESYIGKLLDWNILCATSCTLKVFWVPRSLPNYPGYSTNVEFGYFIDKGPILYGRPDNSLETSYLDFMYKSVLNKKPINNLEELLSTAKNLIEEKTNDKIK
ncbi:MAG: hypothetical protein RSB41_00305 [Bacilli bacterium]